MVSGDCTNGREGMLRMTLRDGDGTPVQNGEELVAVAFRDQESLYPIPRADNGEC